MMKQVLLLITGLLFASSGAFAQQEWEERVVNGNLEGADLSSFAYMVNDDGNVLDVSSQNIVVDNNDPDNHCIKIVSKDSPSASWDTRFFIKIGEPLSVGDKISFSIRAKASKQSHISIQANGAPNVWLHWEIVGNDYNITTEWQTFTYEGYVSQEQKGCQTLSLLLNEEPTSTEFYFDDISMKVTDCNSPINFADAKVKEICVSNWDTNSDGELSYAEAASVEFIGTPFARNQEITSFNELQYFTGLYTITYNAFYGSSLTSVIIPKNVQEIGYAAFQYCYSLTSVTLGDNVMAIDDNAFYFCNHLTTLTIPNSVESIGNYAFSTCYNLTALTIPKSVTFIGEGAFESCSALTSILVEEGNTVYDSRDNCNALIRSNDNLLMTGCMNTVIPSSVTSIGNGAFRSCSGLTSLTIPSSVISIADDAFYGCSHGLTSIVVEEGNPVYDSRDNCNAIIRTADNKLIIGCANTVIPTDVTCIGYGAFYGCENLTTLTVPNSVTAIGANAFHATGWYDNQPDGLVYAGKVAYCYKGEMPENTEIVINEGTLGIASRAFDLSYYDWRTYSTANLISVTIPNSVVSIGDGAFCKCNAITTVHIPNSVTRIGNDVFYGCAGLTSVTIPNNVTSIGDYAFSQSGLTSVTIPNSVTSIGTSAFTYCRALTEVRSMITEPFEIDQYCWDYYSGLNIYDNIPLYVPVGTKEKYEATPGWNQFKNIVEMGIEPVDQGEAIDFGNEIDENTNLNGTVVDNVLVNISNDNGGYDPVEGCIVVNTPTDDSAIDGKDIFGADFKDNYTGIVFKVAPGSGSIKVEAQTTGNMVLKVKIGEGMPITMELEGKLKVTFPYSVTEETNVYVYGGMNTAGAKPFGIKGATSSDNSLKIYGIEVDSNPTGIDDVDVSNESSADAPVYNLNGQRVESVGKGIYIKNGRKVLVK